MSFSKVEFGFYHVGFRVLDGFQIHLKRGIFWGGKSRSFYVVQNFEIFFKLLTIISLEKWFQSGLKIGSCKNALKFIGYIGPIYQKITNFSSHKNPLGFVGFQSSSGFFGFLFKSRIRVSVWKK